MPKTSGNISEKESLPNSVIAEGENSQSNNDKASTSKLLVRNCEVLHHQYQPSGDIPSISQTKSEQENLEITLADPKPYSCIKLADYMKIINEIGCRKVKIPPNKGKTSKNKVIQTFSYF